MHHSFPGHRSSDSRRHCIRRSPPPDHGLQELLHSASRMGLSLSLALSAALSLSLTFPGQAQAQEYPTKPIRLIAPFPPGSGPDVNAREIAGELSKILGQPVNVDNRPGASGIIGTDAGAKAAPDGYTLLVGTTSTMSVLRHLYSKLPFNPERDLDSGQPAGCPANGADRQRLPPRSRPPRK